MIRDRIKELRRVRAGDLRQHPKNWRTHPKGQQAALRGLLKEIGYADACLAYVASDGVLTLVDGHMRAGLDPDQEVPVLVLDVNEAEAEKLLVTLDPLAALAGSDKAVVDGLLSRVRSDQTAVQRMLDDLQDRVAASNPNAKERPSPDAVPDPPAKVITKPGDLWVLGEHRLVCGDSTKAEVVEAVLDGARPQIMVTDPPYGVSYDPAWRDNSRLWPVKRLATEYIPVAGDARAAWGASFAHFKGDIAYVWHGALHCQEVVAALTLCDFEVKSQIVWVKPAMVISRGAYSWRHEPCFYAVRAGANANWCGGKKVSTVWADVVDGFLTDGEACWAAEINPETIYAFKADRTTVWELKQYDGKDVGGHATPKPIECMARPIRNHGAKGWGVYEPFAGTGTTLLAAEMLGRRCFAIELMPQFCDVIIKRWEAYTGAKAVHCPHEQPKPKRATAPKRGRRKSAAAPA